MTARRFHHKDRSIALVSHNLNCRMLHRYTSGLLRSARNDKWNEIVIARSRRRRGKPEVLFSFTPSGHEVSEGISHTPSGHEGVKPETLTCWFSSTNFVAFKEMTPKPFKRKL